MDKTILIITNQADLHADLLIPKIKAFGGTSFRLNLDEFPKNYSLVIKSNAAISSETLTYLPTGQTVHLDNVGAVWLRKKADFSFLSDDLSKQEKQFAIGESEHTLQSLLYSLDCFWLSHPIAVRQACWKLEQTKRAAKFGFSVPDTLVSNDPEEVKQFYSSYPQGIITKAMSGAYLASDEVDEKDVEVACMPTTLIDDEMMEGIDGVKEFPTYFQAYVNKEFELRVTVVGEEVFAAKLNSQDSELTMIDSRDMEADIEYGQFTLPNHIKDLCVKFVKSYGLEYGAIDLIVTQTGDYVFLENNPVGQFLYIEQLVPELSIMDCLAKKLVGEASCQH